MSNKFVSMYLGLTLRGDGGVTVETRKQTVDEKVEPGEYFSFSLGDEYSIIVQRKRKPVATQRKVVHGGDKIIKLAQ